MPLIVLEGLDGAGKSTQVRLLTEYYEKKGKNVYFLHFPRLEAPYWGEMIASFLRGEYGNIDQVHPQLVAALYAGDRWDASAEIKEHLDKGDVVFLDRYVFSNLAYQCAKLNDQQEKEKLRKWILNFEFEYFNIPKPDINIFLDVPPSVVEQKLQENRTGSDREYLKGKSDIHEKSSLFQKKVREEYLFLCKNYDLTYIDCSTDNHLLAPIEVVFERILSEIVKAC
ncbi:MAG TPA: dTMP kinase [Bacteroidales bacterium]|nr:dTMP kinase [Bacteroidales bacterium]